MAPAHCRHGWSVVVRTTSRRPRNGSRASTFVSAWASAEPNISPGGPSASFTRLRAEQTISPPGVEAQAPTAMFPVRSASHAWRNASCHGSSSPVQIRAAAAGGRRAGDPPHESRRPPIPRQPRPGPVTADRLAPGYLHSRPARTPRRRPQQRQDVPRRPYRSLRMLCPRQKRAVSLRNSCDGGCEVLRGRRLRHAGRGA